MKDTASYILFVREDADNVSREVNQTMLAKRALGSPRAAA